MTRVIVRPTAESDIASAVDWYEEEEPGLGIRFADELRATFARIRAMPLQFPGVWRGVRRALLRRFPYAIYFVMRSEREAVIIALMHQRQDSNKWRRRIQDEGKAG